MKKYAYFLLVFFLATMFGCKEQEEWGGTNGTLKAGEFVEGTEFVKLQDDGTIRAGELAIKADASTVNVKWVTDPKFNLDTSQTTVSLKNGKGVLPIKWRGEIKKGLYAPIGMIYKGWVIISSGNKQQCVPLIWTEGEIDAAKVKEQLATRATPQELGVSFIEFSPIASNMSIDRGAYVIMKLTNVNAAVMDYSGFHTSYNVDLSPLPDIVRDPVTILEFKWKNGVASTVPFDVIVGASCAELTGATMMTVSWRPETPIPPGGNLLYNSSNLPAGNIPSDGGTYTFYFSGSYTGSMQLRALSGSTVIATGAEVINKQPAISIPANPSNAALDITFQYKRNDVSDWIDIGPAANKTQDGTSGGSTGDTSVVPGMLVPGGDIPDEGGVVYCNFTGTSTSPLIFRAVTGTTELARTNGNMPSLLSLTIPALAEGGSDRTVAFQYSKDDGSTWVFIDSKIQAVEYLAVNAIQPPYNIPSVGGTYTCTVDGTYTKRVNVHAISNGVVIASGSTAVPGSVQLTIPAFSGAANRLIIFEYSKSNGPWNFMEVKRQLGY